MTLELDRKRQVPTGKTTRTLERLQDRNAYYMDTPSSASNMYGYTMTRRDPVNVYFHDVP